MLIQHHAVEAQLLGEDLLVEIFVEQDRALLRVEMLVRNSEESVFDHLVVGNRPDTDAR